MRQSITFGLVIYLTVACFAGAAQLMQGSYLPGASDWSLVRASEIAAAWPWYFVKFIIGGF